MICDIKLLITFAVFFDGSEAIYDPIYKLFRRDESLEHANACLDFDGGITSFRKEHDFLKKGVSLILWQTSLPPPQSGIQEKCMTDFAMIQSSMKNSSVDALKCESSFFPFSSQVTWFFTVLDASSSVPSGFFEGTLSNLGDFDECIAIKYRNRNVSYDGKYFHFVTYLIDPCNKYKDGKGKGLIDMTEPGLPELGLTTSICLPASCSKDDVFIMIQNCVKSFPFLHVMNDMYSDTAKEMSLTYKVTHLHAIQIWGLLFVSFCITMVFASVLMNPRDGYLKYFDPRENTRKIFYVRKGERKRSLFADLNKTIIVLVAIVMHIVTCADSPRSTAYISHISFVKRLLQNIIIQVVTFEGGFNALAFVSGLNTFEEVYPSLQRNQVNIHWLILNKWLRYIPAFVALLSLQLLWSLISSGPLWTETADLHLNNIQEYWWMVLSYVSNLVPFERQPIAHTNYSMIDFQLYLLGIIGVYLLNKNSRQGFTFALLMILSGYISLGIHVGMYNVQPHFIHPSTILRKVKDNLRYVHFHFHTYLPTYFIGILMAYCVKAKGYHLRNWILGFSMTGFFYFIAVIHPLFLYYFKLIPDRWIPLYVISQKVFLALGIIFNYLRDDCEEEIHKEDMEDKLVETYRQDELRIEIALMKLSSPIYLGSFCPYHIFVPTSSSATVNYWFIKTDFYTKRDLFYTGTYQIICRIAYSYTFIYLIGYLFMICFLMPFDQIRKKVMGELEIHDLKED